MNEEDIKRAIEKAESYRINSDLAKTYEIYCDILIEYLISQPRSTKFSALIMTVLHSLADLAIFFMDFEPADNLLNGATEIYRRANNFSMAYFTMLKRIDLAVHRGENLARDLLQELYPQIGDIEAIEISPSGLIKWEQNCFIDETNLKTRTILFVCLYLAMGKLLSSLGQYGAALIILERGLIHTEKRVASTISRQQELQIKFAIAAACLEKGDLKLAQDKLDILRTEFNEVEQPEALVRHLELCGKIHLLHGNLGQALQNFQQVRQICQKCCRDTSLPGSTLQATINLAHILISLNQTSLARQYLVKALEIAKTLTDSKLVQQISLLIQLAKARSTSLVEHPDTVSEMQGKGKNNSSEDITQSEDDYFYISYSPNYLAKFEDRVLNFHLFLSRLDLESANILLSNIQESFSLSDSKLIQIKINILEELITYYQNVNNNIENIYQAALNLDNICSRLFKLDFKPELWQTQRFLNWCLSRLQKSQLQNLFVGQEPIKQRQEILIKQNQQLLNEITNSLPLEAQAIYSLNKWTSDEESLAADINLLQKLNNKTKESFILLRPWRIWATKLYLHELLERIEDYKDLVAKETVQSKNSSTNKYLNTSLFLRLVTHPRYRITLFFLVLPDRIFVVRIGWLLFDFRVIYIKRLQLRELVQSWHQKVQNVNYKRDYLTNKIELFNLLGSEHLSQDNTNNQRDFLTNYDSIIQKINNNKDFKFELDSVMNKFKNDSKNISKEIAELLEISDLLNDLPKRIKAITIVPDDILHGFPFATIIHQGQYLIENYSLSIAYQTNKIKLSSPIPSKPEKALVVGVSQPASIKDRYFQTLPGVKAEIKKIEDWFKQLHFPRIILENNPQNQTHQEPSKQAVLENLVDATLVHIACHGIFEYNRPDQSGLVLVANSNAEILSLRELSNLDLKQLRHITLSSCWAADHFILPGRWIISVPETLWRSGTQSILGCLWQVSDKIAVPFMADFYENLKRFPRDKALQLTQIKCLKGQLPDCQENTHNPFFWAGFNLYGDGG